MNDVVFKIGDPVEKFTGEAIWHGTVVAAYHTTRNKLRYVVEVDPQGFQMIAVPSQLRLNDVGYLPPDENAGVAESVNDLKPDATPSVSPFPPNTP